MYYSQEIIEEVMQKNDIVDVISQRVRLKKNGSNHMGLCPFHNEKSPSFSVSRTKQMYHCFGCGVGGNVYTFVMEYENYSFVEALKLLADRVGVTLPEAEYTPEQKRQLNTKQQLLEINKKAAIFYYSQLFGPSGANALGYLKGRQLSEEVIKRFGLGYSDISGKNLYKYLRNEGYSDEILKISGLFTFDEKKGAYDKFWNRVMFPIMDVNSKVIGFGGRVMSDAKPKYLNSPETILFDKSRNLFGMNIARTSRSKNIIICEGYMDVISLHQAGFNNAVASLGTALTGLQAALIKRYTEDVILCYDSDEAGTKAAMRAIPILKEAGLTTRVIDLRPYKDPDEFIKELGREEFEKRLDNARTSFNFEMEIIEKNYDLQDPESKTKFINDMAKKMLEFGQEVERNVYAQAVAQKYGIAIKDFQGLVNHYGAIMMSGGKNSIDNIETNSVKHNKKKEKVSTEDAVKKSQRLLLTWMVDDTSLMHKLKEFITPKDFKDVIYNKAAHMLFEQYETEGKVFPASIINAFELKEEQTMVAALFNTDLESELRVMLGLDTDDEIMNSLQKERAINQIVKRIKTYSIEYDLRTCGDIMMIQECYKNKAKLEKMHISL
ncbi:MAG: DNA primase [Lachnospiraceae bacterium]|nr:DNA primase [Lachnospiraceae bacterium]